MLAWGMQEGSRCALVVRPFFMGLATQPSGFTRPPPDLHTPAVHGPNLPAQPIHPPCPLSPPSRLPLRELRISGLASERALYQLALPDELTQLAATLEQLELPRCGLRALPEQAAALAALTSLDLSSNSIVRLPEMR